MRINLNENVTFITGNYTSNNTREGHGMFAVKEAIREIQELAAYLERFHTPENYKEFNPAIVAATRRTLEDCVNRANLYDERVAETIGNSLKIIKRVPVKDALTVAALLRDECRRLVCLSELFKQNRIANAE